jgi:hypothetical protein
VSAEKLLASGMPLTWDVAGEGCQEVVTTCPWCIDGEAPIPPTPNPDTLPLLDGVPFRREIT